MSVVNKMLQDLENRQPNGSDANYVPPQKARGRWKYVAVVLVVGIASMMHWLHQIDSVDEYKAHLPSSSTSTETDDGASRDAPKHAELSNQGSDTVNVSTSAQATVQATSQVSDGVVAKPMVVSSTVAPLQPAGQIIETNSGTLDAADVATPLSREQQLSGQQRSEALPARRHPQTADSVGLNKRQLQSTTNATQSAYGTRTKTSVMNGADIQTDERNQQSDKQVRENQNPEPVLEVIPSYLGNGEAVKWRNQAQIALRTKQTNKAIVALENMLQYQPEDFLAAQQLAKLYLSKNQESKAESTLLAALKVTPEAHSARVMLARLYVKKNLAPQALDVLSAFQPDIAFNAEYYALQGALAQQAQAYDLAYNSYYKLASFQPTEPKWWLGLAVALDSGSEINDARDAYRKALQLTGLPPATQRFIQQRLSVIGG